MKNIKKTIEALLSNHRTVATLDAKLILEAPLNPKDTLNHETIIRVGDVDEIDHKLKVVLLETPYTLTGRYKLTSEDLVRANILPSEFTSMTYMAAVAACVAATGLSYRKINDMMRAAVQKFVSYGMEYGLKEYTFFKENDTTYIGVIMRLQDSASLHRAQSEVKYFVRIAVPVY